MASYPRKYGLASAMDGFSTGLIQGANLVTGLNRERRAIERDQRDDLRQRRMDARSARMEDARLEQIQETTAGMKQERSEKKVARKVDDAAVQADVDMMSQIYAGRKKLRESNPKGYGELAQGMMMAGRVEMNTGESWRAAALVLSSGNMEPLKQVDEGAAGGVKKLLSDSFGIDVEKVDKVRLTDDGGLEVISGGKVVGKMDEFQRINLMSGMRKQAQKHYISAQETIREAENMLVEGREDPKLHSMGEGRHGLLQRGEDGGLALREVPRYDAGGGLIPADKAPEESPGEIKDVRTGEEHVTGVVKGGKFRRLEEETPPPKYAWEAAERLVAADVKTPERETSAGTHTLSELSKLAETGGIWGKASAENQTKYRNAMKEWIHGYIQDVRRAAMERAQKESPDGRYSAKRAAELVLEQINLDGMADLIPYMRANPSLK